MQQQAKLASYANFISKSLPKYIQKHSIYKDELTLYVAPSALIPTISFLKLNSATQYSQIVDICGVDFPTRDKRFEVVYHLLSIHYNQRIRVKTYASETDHVPSITQLYKGANWFEREVWDMFGVYFTGHPDLR